MEWDAISLFSPEHATKVELCLFDSNGARKESHSRVALPEQNRQRVARVCAGYSCRGSSTATGFPGPMTPKAGHRFNPTKVILDPYAKAIGRVNTWGPEMFGYRIGDPQDDLTPDDRDNAALASLGAVIDTSFTWGDDLASCYALV